VTLLISKCAGIVIRRCSKGRVCVCVLIGGECACVLYLCNLQKKKKERVKTEIGTQIAGCIFKINEVVESNICKKISNKTQN